MAPLFLLGVASSVLALASTRSPSTFNVCLSPGCVADGAQETLQKLQALAPPGMFIAAGTCESLCGNGPVVVVTDDTNKNKVVHRRMSGDALLKLLLEADGNFAPPQDLLAGYELCVQGHQASAARDYETAAALYRKGIQLAQQSAISLQSIRDEERPPPEEARTPIPVGLEWMVRAYRGEAEARLKFGDTDGALESANEACKLSCQTHAASLEVLAEACQAGNDAARELDALQAYFALPVDDKLPQAASNRRRQLGFRLVKLEREFNTEHNS